MKTKHLFKKGRLVSAVQFFTPKIQDYWHILYQVNEIMSRKSIIENYYYDISPKATLYGGDFFSDGVYAFRGYDDLLHYYPLEIAQYCLACILSYNKTGNEKWLDSAVIQGTWLLENISSDGSWLHFHGDFRRYPTLPQPWPSALCQGLAVSALLRLYYLTGTSEYKDCAIQAIDFLENEDANIPIKKFLDSNEKEFIYEEYPTSKIQGCLNGYLTVLFALYDANIICDIYEDVLTKNIENSLLILPKYIDKYWTRYSLDGVIASGFYHRLVQIQLTALSKKDDRYNIFLKQFEDRIASKVNCFRAFYMKLSSLK